MRVLGAERPHGADRRRAPLLARVAYWLAVLIVSVALLIALILLLESRDGSSVKGGLGTGGPSLAV